LNEYDDRKLKKLIAIEGLSEIQKVPYNYVTRTKSYSNSKPSNLKYLLTNESMVQQVVYERLFTKSLPQRMRDSFFLTEIYNVKNLIKHNNQTEEISLKLRATDINTNIRETLEPYYKPLPNDNTLVFESRFESGNLCLAVKISDYEYNLLMQNDVNTEGHTQWFYFQVSNTKARTSVKFNIINFVVIPFKGHRLKMILYSTKE